MDGIEPETVGPSCRPSRVPFFLEHSGRRLFAVHHRPDGEPANGGGVVFFAPFAEEMNRARRMATLLAEALSRAGTGTLIFDYAGTGDSDGAFGAFAWSDWIADGMAAIDWLRERHGPQVALAGLRLGAALALQCAERLPGAVSQMVLWQPVISGDVILTQFLRIRVASALAGSGGTDKETTSSLKKRLAEGETLEVAGYALSPDIAQSIAGISLARSAPAHRVSWLEVSTDEAPQPMPASAAVIAAWRRNGVDITARALRGEQFWATQETAVVPALAEATVAALFGNRS